MIVFLMRHGRTKSNRLHIYAGRNDESLIPEGEKSIHEVGRKLADYQIEQIYSSPIRRAVQTAEIINTYLRKSIRIETDFNEILMGPWQGLSETEVAETYPSEWKTWNTKPSRLSLEGRETLEELRARALRALDRIIQETRYSQVLAVSHVALIRVLIIHFNRLPLDDYRKIHIPNGSVFKLDTASEPVDVSRLF